MTTLVEVLTVLSVYVLFVSAACVGCGLALRQRDKDRGRPRPGRAETHVRVTAHEGTVALSVDSGPVWTCALLSTDKARELASALLATADEASPAREELH